MVSRCCLETWWFLGGASMISRWCLGGVSAGCNLMQGAHGVLVVSWWRRVGGVGAVVLVVRGLCHASGSLQRLHAVVMLTITIAEDDDDSEEEDDVDDDDHDAAADDDVAAAADDDEDDNDDDDDDDWDGDDDDDDEEGDDDFRYPHRYQDRDLYRYR